MNLNLRENNKLVGKTNNDYNDTINTTVNNKNLLVYEYSYTSGGDTSQSDLSIWSKSVDNYPSLVGASSNGLLPLWELIPNGYEHKLIK